MRGTEEVVQTKSFTGSDSTDGVRLSWLAAFAIGAIIAVTVIAYSPALFNFFVGDDYVHLVWLKDAVIHPELIWRNFHSSWLDGTTTKFYRPLISVFMVSDYVLWRGNGLGFHLTNLAFQLMSSLLMFGIVKELQRDVPRASLIWPLAACAIFALYPLHPEAVSWITGRVDAIVTTFCLGTMWTYMRWRAGGRWPWLAASLASFVLGLTSKEMAITVPAVLVALEVCFGLGRNRMIATAVATVKRTWVYWAVIAGYFVVRWISLGTFVGGYDDSLLFISDVKAFINGWLHALRMTIIPLNKEIFGAHHVATKAWEIAIAVCSGAAVISAARNKTYRPALLFLLCWFALSLAPVYKIFAIADDLQGSRLAYLATAPLSAILAFGIATIGGARVRAVACTALACLSAFILWSNNQPWRQAGLQANAIRAALEGIYQGVDDDPQTLVIGLPDQIHGAYVARNALWGMTKVPQLSKQVMNCLMVNEFEPVQPFGYLKDSMIASRGKVRAFAWSPDQNHFRPIQFPTSNELVQPVALTFQPDTTHEGKPSTRPAYLIDCAELPCWNVDFVRVGLKVKDAGQVAVGADLLYSNDLAPTFELAHRTHADMSDHALLFSLHALPQWALGSTGGKLKLLLPPGCNAEITSIEAVPPAVLLPRMSFPNSGYMGTKGYYRLDKKAANTPIQIDASTVPGATSTALEVTRANLLFEEQNCTHTSKISRPLIPCDLKGTIALDIKDFKAPGIYEARLWARDKANNLVGLASDHIVISVDP